MLDRHVPIPDAATMLGLPVSAVHALVDAGYLARTVDGGLRREDVVAFAAGDAGRGRPRPRPAAAAEPTGDTPLDVDGVLRAIDGAGTGAEDILDVLEASIDDMARRAADVVSGLFPDAEKWDDRARDWFERDARERFAAILAVTRSEVARGEETDDLLGDLADAGGAAAYAGAPLPEVLLTLRVSRDLLVQTAVGAAEDLGGAWGLALAVLLTRVLPVLDRLTDSVARGWWSAALRREQESFQRYEHVVEHATSGVYEVDATGRVVYANPALTRMSAIARADLVGADLSVALPAVDASVPADVYRTPTPDGWRTFDVRRADGVVRSLQIRVTARTEDGVVVGFDGVVADVTAEHALERQKNDFLALITQELRRPLTTVLGTSVLIESHADELPRERLAQMGRTIHLQSERIARLADDLHDVSRIRADDLAVSVRPVRVAEVCAAAYRMLHEPEDVDHVVPRDLLVQADPRRLEQVVAHLVENGLRHGRPPVEVAASEVADGVLLRVSDRGAGIAPEAEATLYADLRPTVGAERLRDRPSGIGLPLARSLVEAMGGRIGHRHDGCGTHFEIHLPLGRG